MFQIFPRLETLIDDDMDSLYTVCKKCKKKIVQKKKTLILKKIVKNKLKIENCK